MNDLVYVMCNTKLETKKTRKQVEVEDMPPDDEWILETNRDETSSPTVGDLDVDSANNEEGDFSLEEGNFDIGGGLENDDEFGRGYYEALEEVTFGDDF